MTNQGKSNEYLANVDDQIKYLKSIIDTDKIKISVIIPVYNAEKYLKQCLNSITNQTLKEIEIICIDDGSTDESLNIIKSLSKRDRRIKLFSMTKNSGSGPARNKGLKIAKGKYISFIDSDDFIVDNTAYERIYNFASENNAKIVSGNIKAFDDKYNFSKLRYCDEIKNYSSILPQNYGTPWFFQKNLFKLDFLNENNIRFPDYRRGQDPVFFVKSLIKVNRVYCVPTDFYAYRLSPYSIKPEEEEKELDYIRHFKHVLEILGSVGFKDMYLEYEKIMYNFLVNHKKWTSSKTLKKNIEIVFGENGKVLNNFESKISQLKEENINTNPKISVIVPVYNVEKYLRHCLESIINQTLKELEIICVNDGSTDSSPIILKEYAHKDKRIKIINKKNEGLGAARKTGLKVAKGDFIAFVDSDDWLKLNAYEKAYNNAISNNSDIVIYDIIRYDENKNSYVYWNGTDLTQYFDKNINFDKFHFNYTHIKPYVLNRSYSACTKLYRTEFLEKYDDFYFPKYTAFEDVPFHLQVLLRAGRISFYKDKLYVYRISNSSSIINSSRNNKKIFDIFKIANKVENILIESKKMNEFKYEFYSFKVFQLIQWFNKCDMSIKEKFFVLMKENFSKIKFDKNFNSREDDELINKYHNVMNSNSYKEFELLEENKRLLKDNNLLKSSNNKLEAQLKAEKSKMKERITTKGYLHYKSKNIATRFKNKIREYSIINQLNDKKINIKLKIPKYKKLTFIIPYRKSDDPDREKNLDITLRYLSKIGIHNVIISEHANVTTKSYLFDNYANLFKSFKVVFTEANSAAFNLAKTINNGVVASNTPYIAYSDVDCLTKKKNINYALELLHKGFDVVHPFNKRVTDIIDKETFKINFDFDTVDSTEQDRPWADGGIVFWNKRSFISVGMSNEYFTGWGGEDNDIMTRASLCHLKQYRINDTLYHLYHYRPLKRTQNNVEQLRKTKQMKSIKECLTEVNQWPWVINAKKLNFNDKKLTKTKRLILKLYPIYILLNRKNSIKNALITIKGYRAIKKNYLLDKDYYLRNSPDIKLSGMDPILHYIYYGFKEGRNPNSAFDSGYYLTAYGDVKNSDLNPLVHYSLYGINEQRKTKN